MRIIGGGPYEQHGAIVDVRGAVLVDRVGVVAINRTESGITVGLELAGRINHSTDRIEQLFLTDLDGAAMVTAELLGLAQRAGCAEQFAALVRTHVEALP